MLNQADRRQDTVLCPFSVTKIASLASVLLVSSVALPAIAAEPPLGFAAKSTEPSKSATQSFLLTTATAQDERLNRALLAETIRPNDISAPGAAASLVPDVEPVAVSRSVRVPPAATTAAALTGVEPLVLAQVAEIDELTDVSPNEWAYRALASLVEDYACLEGYPDLTYRGDRALTRDEFAAGLDACLNALLTLIDRGSVIAEDLATIQRLSEEFTAELAEVGGRLDTLESEVAELREQQFATVTKLRGNVFAHISGGFADGAIQAEGINAFAATRDAAGNPVVRTIDDNPSTVFAYYTWINFDSSFTGSDKLTLQLVAGNGNAPANLYVSGGLFNTYGTPFTLQRGTPAPAGDVYIRELSYGFPIGDKLSVEVGPRVNWYRFFDNNRYTFFLTGANSFNASGGTQVNAVDRGTGAIAVWDVTDWLDLRVGWLAENTEFLTSSVVSDPSRGLFGGAHTLTTQVGLQPFDKFNLRFMYNRTRLVPNGAGQIGGAVSEPLYGLADDGLGGRLDGATADTFLVNFDWTPLDWLGFFGRYSYGSTNLIDNGDDIGEVDAQSFQFGLGFPDLFKEGALASVSYVIPFDILDGDEFLVSGAGDGGTQQELELAYRYPLSANIAIMPSFYWIINANNFDDNPSIFLFNLQTQLFF
ncbi:MAG: iron uptake porin [Cyanobacteria bacterium P01_D01_bin.71]